jgi:hypothetical protein
MRIKFQADTANTDTIDGAIIIGFSAGEKYLMIQRSTDPEDDCGIYLEFSDQMNSGYNLISECRISEKEISIDLKDPMNESIEGFDIELNNTGSIKNNLQEAFRGQKEKLK